MSKTQKWDGTFESELQRVGPMYSVISLAHKRIARECAWQAAEAVLAALQENPELSGLPVFTVDYVMSEQRDLVPLPCIVVAGPNGMGKP